MQTAIITQQGWEKVDVKKMEEVFKVYEVKTQLSMDDNLERYIHFKWKRINKKMK